LDYPQDVYHLWKYDGTSASQVVSAPNYPADFAAVGDNLYFRANDGNGNRGFWVTDGTTTRELVSLPGDSNLLPMVSFDNKLFFAGYDSTLGAYTLWSSDGTVNGTTQFLTTTGQPVELSSAPDLTVVGNELYADFLSVGGQQVLGKTDGTAAGTTIVQAGFQGAVAYDPSNMVDDSGLLVFNGYDSAHGYELWQSDGTAAGTLLAADINPGTASGNPVDIAVAGSQAFFNADDGIHGQELWTATLGSSVVTAGMSGASDLVGAATASIVGGSGTNIFNVSTGGSLSGTLNGGSGSGNSLSYAKYTTSGVVVDLLLGSATAIDGGANGGISGIRNVTGSKVGGDILVGDANANKLTTIKGHNILIGGAGGGDTLASGAKGADILIAGSTNYDTNIAALQVILATRKTSTASNYASVINTIMSSSFADPLNTSTVSDSGAGDLADTLNGSNKAATDWFFAHLAGGSEPNDAITGEGSGDIMTGI
jgi:ELWxxDGT repeat protein